MKSFVVVPAILVFVGAMTGCGGKGGGNNGFRVGGTVIGLTGTLTLQNNQADDLTLEESGPFNFRTRLADGEAYAVTVLTHPAGQICSIVRGQGTVAGADVTDVLITCADEANTYTVGGTVTGLSGTVTLQNNGGDDLTLSQEGSFVFAERVADGSPYEVTVASQPASLLCFVTSGQGVISGADVADVTVSCGAPGTLDPSYGAAGIAAEGVGGESNIVMALHPDGRTILAGSYHTPNGGQDIFLKALTGSGALDPDFGDAGMVIFDNPQGTDCDDGINAITVDGQGGILVAGYTICATDAALAVWRFMPDGSADPTFGQQGQVTWTEADTDFYGYGVAADSNDRILVAGLRLDAAAERDVAVFRFDHDGAPDAAFGTAGFATFNDLAGGAGWDQGTAVAVTGDDRIVVTGFSDADPGPSATFDMVLLRLDANGSLDPTFGQGGVVSHNNAGGGDGWDRGYAVVVDGSNRILVAGTSAGNLTVDGFDVAVVWRYLSDGSLDPAFGQGGVAVAGNPAGGGEFAWAMTLDAQGRILVAGATDSDPEVMAENLEMAAWRFTADGTLDGSFGTGGWFVSAGVNGAFNRDAANSIAVDPQGRILVGGALSNGSSADPTVWRLFP